MMGYPPTPVASDAVALLLQPARTADGALCLALGCTALLLWSQQEAEMQHLMVPSSHGVPASLQRCMSLSTLLGDAARFVRHAFLAHTSAAALFSTPARTWDLEQLPPYQAVLTRTRSLTWQVTPDEVLCPRAEQPLFQQGQALTAASAEVCATLALCPAAHLATAHLWPVEQVRALTTTYLGRSHAVPEADRWRIVVAQLLGVLWERVACALLQEAITLLALPDVPAAVRRVISLSTLLHQAWMAAPLDLPGEATDSPSWPALAILLGQHEVGAQARMAQQGRWTPELAAAPSLHDALLTLLLTRGVLPPRTRQPIFLGRAWAQRLLEARAEDADLWALLHALTCLQHAVHLWGAAHLEHSAEPRRDGARLYEEIGRAYRRYTLTATPFFPACAAAWQVITRRRPQQERPDHA